MNWKCAQVLALISNQRHHLDLFNLRQKSKWWGKYFGFIFFTIQENPVFFLFTYFLKYTTRVFRAGDIVSIRWASSCPVSTVSAFQYPKRKSPHVRKSRFRNPENLCLWNPESWALEYGTQLKVSEIPRTIRIQNPSSPDNDWNSVLEIRNPRRGIQNPRLLWTWLATERL